MINHRYNNVIHQLITSSNCLLLTRIYSHLFFNVTFVLYYLTLYTTFSIHGNTIHNIDELTFKILEELPKGTIIASNHQLGNLFIQFNNHHGNNQNLTKLIKILNLKDSGVQCFQFKWVQLNQLNELQLIVNDRIDRELICPLINHELSSMTSSISSSSLDLHHGNDPTMNTDCIITLRIGLFMNNIQKFYQIHIIIEDINDNIPKWNINKIIINFHDEDQPGTKQSIPLAKDIDIGINAKIHYQLFNSDINSYNNDNNNNNNNDIYSYILNKAENLKLRGTDIFELMIESRNSDHERLFLITQSHLDRETNPYGWYLLLMAINNESLIQLSSNLLIHINLIDINDNSPKFTQLLYKPQLSNQKIGSIPENYPVGKTILKVHAIDIDEGKNAEINYNFAPDTTNQLIHYFFEITKNGELRILHPLNVDIITYENTNRLYLPTTMINFDIIAIDGAILPYTKTGSTTIQIEIENIDDESPIIQIHPIQFLSQDTFSILNNQRIKETELTILENQSPGQLIALIEVKDPDLLIHNTIQCILTGPYALDFRLSYQDSINHEYRLYTETILDREKQDQLLLSIECKDQANHITLDHMIIHILDINDHKPQCIESHYYFSLYEDDNEYDNYNISSINRTWLTTNGLAYIIANDNDIELNSQINYRLSIESINNYNNQFTINSITGQLLAWGPFDRELISIYELLIIIQDNGYPIQLNNSCQVTINILDINDNSPIFYTPFNNHIGGYIFNINENQLPGTWIGQIQAYDLDDLPASINIIEYLNDYTTTSTTTNNNKVKGINKKLTYSLKNEHTTQMFRIDPKTGVIMTRAILDREIQATYTFYAYVHDGPDNIVQITNTSNSNTEIQRTINSYRSHTASIMITITVQDENDNDPVFVRPNSTNHMILLNPSAIPGQSLSQLLAIDPDEGLNGHVSYAIKGETAGILFNVDPRTGLLYLESQIPRQYLTNNKQKTTINNQGNDVTYPTFLLAIDACDHGEPRRCTHFPNLQIQIRSSSNIIDEVTSNEYRQTDLSINQQVDDIFISQSNHGSVSSSSSSGSGTSTTYLGRNSLGEILIIGLSIFFSILVLIILFTVCIVRRRTQQIMQNNERINPELLKLNHGSTGFNVESHEKDKRTKPRVKLSNWNTSKKDATVKKSFILRLITQQSDQSITIKTDNENVITTSPTSVLPISCNLSINSPNPLTLSSTSSSLSSSTSQIINQSKLNYSIGLMNSRFYNPNIHHSMDYGPYSPICVNTTNTIPVISDDYQSLDCWDHLPVAHYSNQFKQDNSINLNLPQFYMKQLKQPIIENHSNLNFINKTKSSSTSTTTTTSVLHNKQKDLINSNWTPHNTHILMSSTNSSYSNSSSNHIHNNTNNSSIISKDDIHQNSKLNQQNVCKNKEHSQAYTGLVKSTFV
ncbi:unnamed protein product [Schistosoma rodhaini]|nr:unnamed protein product [Schistosoma rodhaini]